MSISAREHLEAALMEEFENLATHSAYADLLMEENDPRGEYIHLRLQLEDTALPVRQRREIEQRAAEIYQRCEADWLGDLAGFLLARPRQIPAGEAPNYDYTFHRGWLWELDVQDVRHSFTEVLAECQQAKLLHRLILRNTNLRNNDRVLQPLTVSTNLSAVRFFQLGDWENFLARVPGGESIPELLPRMPRIEDLVLLADGVDGNQLFRMPFQNLRSLDVHHLAECPLSVLGQNPTLISLHTLRLTEQHQFAPDDEFEEIPRPLPDLPRREFRAFFGSPYLVNLRELKLIIPRYGDQLCQSFAESSKLSHLRHLCLRGSQITDAGAEFLARSEMLSRLDLLDLSANQLTSSGIDRLRERGVTLQYDSQMGMQYEEGDGMIF